MVAALLLASGDEWQGRFWNDESKKGCTDAIHSNRTGWSEDCQKETVQQQEAEYQG